MTHANHLTVTYLDSPYVAQLASLHEPAGAAPAFSALHGTQGVKTWLAAQAHEPQTTAPATGNPVEAAPGAHSEAGAQPETSAKTENIPTGYQMPGDLPNIYTLLKSLTGTPAETKKGERPEYEPFFHVGPVPIPVNPLFSIFYALLILWVVRKAFKRPNIQHPGLLQVAVETLLGGLRNFFLGTMGPGGEKFVPYVGTVWLFILVNNLAGLVPGLKSPTSSIKTTFALGICTFCYVQYTGLRESGPKKILYHLIGSPKFDFAHDFIGSLIILCMVPLFLVLEVIGELVKPVSLSLRLFGNIFGEDKLLASFLGMGMMIVGAIFGTAHPVIGVPLHLPFFFLALLTSVIQATVFSLLASVYIMVLLPHEDHGHEEHAAAPATEPESGTLAAASQV